MGPKQDNVIRLVLVEDSVEDAEQLVSVLRGRGIRLDKGSRMVLVSQEA